MDFRFHADDHGCIRVQLGDEPSEDDPTIITGPGTMASWARKLVEQANRPHEPHLWQGTTSAWTLTPTPSDDPINRFERLLTAARETTAWYDEHETPEDVSQEMAALLGELREAHQAWGSK